MSAGLVLNEYDVALPSLGADSSDDERTRADGPSFPLSIYYHPSAREPSACLKLKSHYVVRRIDQSSGQGWRCAWRRRLGQRQDRSESPTR